MMRKYLFTEQPITAIEKGPDRVLRESFAFRVLERAAAVYLKPRRSKK